MAGATTEQELALKNFGMYMGTAFQIVDDVLDYSGSVEQIGKNVGDDLAEGKPTLPLIYLMQQGSEQAAHDVQTALKNADREYFEVIHNHVMQSSALDYCLEQAQQAVDKAIICLDKLPENEVTHAMRELAYQSIQRAA